MNAEVLVTGMGAVTPVGEGGDGFFDALLGRRCGIEDGVAACGSFDPERWMTPKEARRADRFSQFALAAADQAAEQAGLPDGVEPERLGVVVGTGVGGLGTLQEQCGRWLEQGDRAVSPQFVPMMMPNAAAALVAMRLGARGPGFSLASACATGAHAIGEGTRIIARGEADVVVAGGAEAALTGLCLAAFKQMGATSRSGSSRPFDARRDGFVMGEGAAVLVLESGEHARARGATPRARIAGYGASNDAFHITQPDEGGRGAISAMRAALRDADASPADVGYVNAHGTSTPFNDRVEARAIRAVWNGGQPPPVSSIKGAVGHGLGAAGAVETAATVASIVRGLLPPTLGYGEPDPECEIDCVPDGPREVVGLELALCN